MSSRNSHGVLPSLEELLSEIDEIEREVNHLNRAAKRGEEYVKHMEAMIDRDLKETAKQMMNLKEEMDKLVHQVKEVKARPEVSMLKEETMEESLLEDDGPERTSNQDVAFSFDLGFVSSPSNDDSMDYLDLLVTNSKSDENLSCNLFDSSPSESGGL